MLIGGIGYKLEDISLQFKGPAKLEVHHTFQSNTAIQDLNTPKPKIITTQEFNATQF